jgi:hypothetical protein
MRRYADGVSDEFTSELKDWEVAYDEGCKSPDYGG